VILTFDLTHLSRNILTKVEVSVTFRSVLVKRWTEDGQTEGTISRLIRSPVGTVA